MHVIDVNKTPAHSLRNWRTGLRIVRLAARAFEGEFFVPSGPERALWASNPTGAEFRRP
jgi:hypothetical protein